MENLNVAKRGCLKRSIPVVVVADDCPDNLLFIGFILVALNVEYYLAKDSKEALDLVNKKLPDLAILDIVMPHFNGIEVNIAIKGNSSTSHIKTLATTGLARPEHTEAILSSGFDDYLIKPFLIEDLELKLEQILKIS